MQKTHTNRIKFMSASLVQISGRSSFAVNSWDRKMGLTNANVTCETHYHVRQNHHFHIKSNGLMC